MTYPPKSYYESPEEKKAARQCAVVGLLGLAIVLSVFFGAILWGMYGCGAVNQTYLDKDWPQFQTECVEYCAPEEAHPSQDQDPWVCGCPDDFSVNMDWREVYFVHQMSFME